MSQSWAAGSSLMVDARRTVQRARRALDAKLGATQRVRRRGDLRPEIEQAAAHLGQREDRGGLAGTAPAPPGAQPARVRDRRVAGLGAASATAALDRRRLGDRRDVGVREHSQVAGATGKTAVGRPAAAQTVSYRPRSGSMITRVRWLCPNGGIPPIVKPVSSSASRAVARRMSRRPTTAASRSRSTRSAPDTRHTIGSRLAVLARGHEDQRLDDLADLRADRTRPPPRRCGWSRQRP